MTVFITFTSRLSFISVYTGSNIETLYIISKAPLGMVRVFVFRYQCAFVPSSNCLDTPRYAVYRVSPPTTLTFELCTDNIANLPRHMSLTLSKVIFYIFGGFAPYSQIGVVWNRSKIINVLLLCNTSFLSS